MTLRIAVLATALGCLAGCSLFGDGLLKAEPSGGKLANGQSVLVDDGRCPAGQVSRVTGSATLTAPRTYACVAKPSGGMF